MLRPNPGMLDDARRFLVNPMPEPDAAPPSPQAAPQQTDGTVTTQGENATIAEGVANPSGSGVRPISEPTRADEATLPPILLPNRPDEAPLPPILTPTRSAQAGPGLSPPPMGFSPLQRRLAGTARLPQETAAIPPEDNAPEEDVELAKASRAAAKGDLARALALAERSVACKEGRIEARLFIANIKLHSGEIGEARELAEKVIESTPASAEAHAILGRVHLELGQIPQAEKEYRTALSLDPNCNPARIGMARIAVERLRNQ